MISPEKTGMLNSFLGSLPEEIALQLAHAVEVDRLVDGKTLPYEIIMEGLRPALRYAANAQRTLTPLRYFSVPFEDLFVSGPLADVKQKGQISRVSVGRIWTWLSQTLLPDEAKDYGRDFREALLKGNQIEAKKRAELFWLLAANAINEALSTNKGRDVALDVLGSKVTLADASEAALLLSVGPTICKIQQLVPHATPALSEKLLWELRAVYDALINTNPDAAPYVAVVAMNRLARPWEALRLPLNISRQTRDTLISSTDMGLVGEIILADIERHGNAVLQARHQNFDSSVLIENMSQFTALSTGIVQEVDILRGGKWGQRLLKDRTEVASAMDAFMERAPKELSAALPYHRGFTGGPKLPDFSRPVDSNRIDRALHYCHLVHDCKPFAAAGSFGTSVKTADEAMCYTLRNFNEDVIKELRASDAKRRTDAQTHLETAKKLTTVLFSPEEAELLRRRARAALDSARAA